MFDPLVPSANPLRARIQVGHMSNQCEKKEDSHHKVSKKNLKTLFYQNEASYSYHKEWPQRLKTCQRLPLGQSYDVVRRHCGLVLIKCKQSLRALRRNRYLRGARGAFGDRRVASAARLAA